MLSFLPVRLLSLSLSLLASQSPLTGVVVDQDGRPVPRAIVQVTGSDGSVVASTVTDTDGGFRLAGGAVSCRVEAALTGFEKDSTPCDAAAPLRLILKVAPVAEDIVVSATRTEAPAGQVAASVTVFDAADIERRQQPSNRLRRASRSCSPGRCRRRGA